MMDGFKRSLYLGSLVLFFAVWCVPVHAAIKPAGQVVLSNGTFLAIQSDNSTRSLARGSEFYQGDRLWTGPRTKAQIRFSDGAIMTLRPDTEFSVDEYEFDNKNAHRNKSLFTLIKGGFRTLTGLVSRLRPDSYKVKTAYAIVGVRGTTYETFVDNALWVAAWQGSISVANDGGEVNLGFGEEQNFARVTSFNTEPTGLLATPPQLLESVDPNLQEEGFDSTVTDVLTGLLRDGNDPRLTQAEAASLDRVGFATFGQNGAGVNSRTIVTGLASDGSSGSPLFFDVSQDTVLRRGTAAGSDTVDNSVNVGGFPVSFGSWDSPTSPAQVQPDGANPSVVQGVGHEVFWIAMLPATNLPTGNTVYNFAGPAISSDGNGSGGAATVLTFAAELNFGAGTLTNGNMVVTNADTWNVDFSGTVNGATFNATVNPVTSLVNTSPAQGTVVGGVTGPNATGIGGVFNLEEVGNPSTFVDGAFVAQ